LGGLTSLRLRLRQGPFHAETPAPGGGVGREGGTALARGLPRLEALGLVGVSVAREGLLEIVAGLTGLQALDLSGEPGGAAAPVIS
jgi:hypothetical protein